ncbi:hypothetical protein OGAPHI_000718 [Ogataea philodendri]|uniref:Uncharacterized protein n=1 Tax=Ogataea philodendri TaxID=1378263 RepID=A0A9P8PGU2_9ASCO|nr:uncharacterized protein OGAPHI_000718 [Ogataea philodendri]KAH3671007.1 hypothetical protein OGAPHI_000718 [Ogataea philodendri]
MSLANTVTNLDTVSDLAVFLVGLVVLVGHDPLVRTKHSAGLQHLVDLAVHSFENRSMHSGLDRVHSVETVWFKVHLHEVALHKRELVVQLELLGVVVGSLDLVVVVVQTNNLTVGEPSDLSGRASNTASDIQHLHVFAESHLQSKVMFVSGHGLSKGLTFVVSGKVERRAPTILVKVGHQVVVVLGERRVVLQSGLFCVLVGLTVPVLEPITTVATTSANTIAPTLLLMVPASALDPLPEELELELDVELDTEMLPSETTVEAAALVDATLVIDASDVDASTSRAEADTPHVDEYADTDEADGMPLVMASRSSDEALRLTGATASCSSTHAHRSLGSASVAGGDGAQCDFELDRVFVAGRRSSVDDRHQAQSSGIFAVVNGSEQNGTGAGVRGVQIHRVGSLVGEALVNELERQVLVDVGRFRGVGRVGGFQFSETDSENTHFRVCVVGDGKREVLHGDSAEGDIVVAPHAVGERLVCVRDGKVCSVLVERVGRVRVEGSVLGTVEGGFSSDTRGGLVATKELSSGLGGVCPLNGLSWRNIEVSQVL